MDADQLDRVFKALADPTRRRIIDHLRERPGQSLFQICALAMAGEGKALSRQATSASASSRNPWTQGPC